MAETRFYYGWIVAGAGFVCYGLGLATGYVSWGFYGPEVIEDLKLTKPQQSLVFGVFGLIYSFCAPLTAALIYRIGLRLTMVLGLSLAAVGFGLVSVAQSMWHCLLAYSVMGGIGVGLGAQLPVQTIASVWFKKYRARALAIMLTGGGIVGVIMPFVNKAFLEHATWRAGWIAIGIAGLLPVAAAAFLVRNRPQDLGLEPDGAAQPSPKATSPAAKPSGGAPQRAWSVKEAILTPQFLLISLAAFGSSAPWAAWTNHSRLHLGGLGLTLATIASVLAVGSFISTWGRFSGSVADFIEPPKVMAASLMGMALGFFGLIFASIPWVAYVSVTFFSLGFGISLLAIPLVMAHFFGPSAFAGTQGISRCVLGLARFASPTLTGFLVQKTGSYTLPFLLLAGVSLTGAIIALVCPPPKLPARQSEPNLQPADPRAA